MDNRRCSTSILAMTQDAIRKAVMHHHSDVQPDQVEMSDDLKEEICHKIRDQPGGTLAIRTRNTSSPSRSLYTLAAYRPPAAPGSRREARERRRREQRETRRRARGETARETMDFFSYETDISEDEPSEAEDVLIRHASAPSRKRRVRRSLIRRLSYYPPCLPDQRQMRVDWVNLEHGADFTPPLADEELLEGALSGMESDFEWQIEREEEEEEQDYVVIDGMDEQEEDEEENIEQEELPARPVTLPTRAMNEQGEGAADRLDFSPTTTAQNLVQSLSVASPPPLLAAPLAASASLADAVWGADSVIGAAFAPPLIVPDADAAAARMWQAAEAAWDAPPDAPLAPVIMPPPALPQPAFVLHHAPRYVLPEDEDFDPIAQRLTPHISDQERLGEGSMIASIFGRRPQPLPPSPMAVPRPITPQPLMVPFTNDHDRTRLYELSSAMISAGLYPEHIVQAYVIDRDINPHLSTPIYSTLRLASERRQYRLMHDAVEITFEHLRDLGRPPAFAETAAPALDTVLAPVVAAAESPATAMHQLLERAFTQQQVLPVTSSAPPATPPPVPMDFTAVDFTAPLGAVSSDLPYDLLMRQQLTSQHAPSMHSTSAAAAMAQSPVPAQSPAPSSSSASSSARVNVFSIPGLGTHRFEQGGDLPPTRTNGARMKRQREQQAETARCIAQSRERHEAAMAAEAAERTASGQPADDPALAPGPSASFDADRRKARRIISVVDPSLLASASASPQASAGTPQPPTQRVLGAVPSASSTASASVASMHPATCPCVYCPSTGAAHRHVLPLPYTHSPMTLQTAAQTQFAEQQQRDSDRARLFLQQQHANMQANMQLHQLLQLHHQQMQQAALRSATATSAAALQLATAASTSPTVPASLQLQQQQQQQRILSTAPATVQQPSLPRMDSLPYFYTPFLTPQPPPPPSFVDLPDANPVLNRQHMFNSTMASSMTSIASSAAGIAQARLDAQLQQAQQAMQHPRAGVTHTFSLMDESVIAGLIGNEYMATRELHMLLSAGLPPPGEAAPVGALQRDIEKYSTTQEWRITGDADVDPCTVCMSEFEEGESVRVLPCNHSFHVRCIDRWLSYNKKCPNCRVDLDQQAAAAAAAARAATASAAETALTAGDASLLDAAVAQGGIYDRDQLERLVRPHLAAGRQLPPAVAAALSTPTPPSVTSSLVAAAARISADHRRQASLNTPVPRTAEVLSHLDPALFITPHTS